MKHVILLIIFIVTNLYAYVPSPESLLRRGSNPDPSAPVASVTAAVQLFNPMEEKTEGENASQKFWIRWIIQQENDDSLRVTQLIYNSATMVDESLVEKNYYSRITGDFFNNFNSSWEKGMFYSLMGNLVFNNSELILSFLRKQGVKLSLNKEIMNQSKINLIGQQRYWLNKTNGGKNATVGDDSPLNPRSYDEKNRVAELMNSPMYLNEGNVKLDYFQNEFCWMFQDEKVNFWVSDKERELRLVKIKEPDQESHFELRDWGTFNGSVNLPRNIYVKSFEGQQFEVNITGVKYFRESSVETINRLKKLDLVLKNNKKTITFKPNFIL